MKFTFDSLEYKYPSRRNVVFGKKGMVATGNILASEAGLDIIKRGGNAIDAAVATAATLTVVEPTSNGLGGDAFAIVWFNGEIYGLNGSGFSPKSLNVDTVLSLGYEKMPNYGLIPITVGGIPGTWEALIKRFGKLTLKEVLEPAIRYAKEGYVVQAEVSKGWEAAFNTYKKELSSNDEFQGWFDTFSFNGTYPKVGEIVKLPYHAKTLEDMSRYGADIFYKGDIAERIDLFMKKYGGYLTKEDLSLYEPEWVTPLSVNYRGFDIHELPPNGHGITVLMALNILKRFDLKSLSSFETRHLEIEALKIAFTDVQKYVSDSRHMKIKTEELLSEDYAEKMSSLITKKALDPKANIFSSGGTVYLASADGEGNMVSFIESNYIGFGSGIVIPETGVALHNRGANFSLDETSGNYLMPLKKPYHTIIPGFISKDKTAVGPFGVMGAFMQPQGHLQVLTNIIDYNMNPQEALDKPRWQWTKSKTIELEQGFDNTLALKLLRAGHDIDIKADSTSFGRGEIILRNDNGVLCGGCEPRTDAGIAVW